MPAAELRYSACALSRGYSVKPWDHRISPPASPPPDLAGVVADLQKRNHKVELRPPYDSGAAPAIIRLNPSGMIEAGSDPFYYRAARVW